MSISSLCHDNPISSLRVITGIKTLNPAADDLIMFGIGIWEIALLKCRDQDSYMHELMIALVKSKQKNLTRRKLQTTR